MPSDELLNDVRLWRRDGAEIARVAQVSVRCSQCSDEATTLVDSERDRFKCLQGTSRSS